MTIVFYFIFNVILSFLFLICPAYKLRREVGAATKNKIFMDSETILIKLFE